MVGLTSVLLTGLSALRTSQTALAVTSNNVANANTPGYVRAEVSFAARTQLGAGGGVEVSAIKRAADQFLATASYIANAGQAGATARSDLLTRAQASFGDPSGTSSMFAGLDEFWSALTELGVDPSSTLRRDQAVSSLSDMYAEVQRVGQDLQNLTIEADQRIGDAVANAQSLVDRIASLNSEIRLTKRSGADTTPAENAQSALIDELSGLIAIRVEPQSDGSVHVRTSGGASLVGVTAAKLSYAPSSAPFGAHGSIMLNEDLGANTNLEPFLLGGEIKGLLQARDVDLPGLSVALGSFAGTLGDVLNEIHNENASAPPLSSLTGRNTGLLAADDLGFTGKAIIGVTSAGVLANRLTIDFDAQTITGEAPAATYSFSGGSIANFVTALNTALGAGTPAGSASFAGGSLSMSVAGSGGLVVQQDEAAPAIRADRGFSHFFGLNDLVSRPTPIFYKSGVNATDLHGFNAGGAIAFSVRDSAGREIAQRSISIGGALAAPTATWNDLVTALNASGTGLGGYGTFSLDSSGRVTLSTNAGFSIQLVADSTTRGDTGISLTALNGLSTQSRAGRALDLDVNSRILNDPSKLAVGRPDLSVALGSTVIEQGDNHGAAALLEARDLTRVFSAAGAMPGQTTSLGVYAARLGGEAGRLAANAQRDAKGAEAIATAANDRRAQIEGVSLDDELMKMTVYQNAYAAAARVIQAATDMLDVLMSIGYR